MLNKRRIWTKTRALLMLASSAVLLVGVVSGCADAAAPGDSPDSRNPKVRQEEHDGGSLIVGRGEHDREGGEDAEHGEGREGSESGEESGTEFAVNETYDEVRNGARLVLAYDVQENAFNGTVENTTDDILQRVRVEVHLSNGIELGPTTPIDLAAGEIVSVTLPASSRAFDGWSAHPEVGSGEGGGEHGSGG